VQGALFIFWILHTAFSGLQYGMRVTCQPKIFQGEIAMQINLFMPRVAHRIQKNADEIYKFIGNYIYYRKCFHNHKTAWNMAKNTL